MRRVAFGPAGAAYDSAQEVVRGGYVEFDTAGNPMGVEITSVRWISEGRRGARGKRHAEKPAAE